MKQKIVLLAIAILCGMNVLATNLVIERYVGVEMVQDIAVIGKWVFVDTNLQLLDKEGNILATEPLDNVRKIVFSNESITTELENVENEQSAAKEVPPMSASEKLKKEIEQLSMNFEL